MTLNIFEEINNSISDFVENQENKALKRGTGSYSIPFRGSIFGETETAKVLSKLNAESVDVIWLGSNPNVPESLDAILSPSSPSHYEGFVQQAMNDNFSEAYKNSDGANVPLWDPINKPNNKWQFYSEIFNKRFGEHKTLMANIVLWGSKDFKSFTSQLAKYDKALLERAIQFSYELNNQIIEYFKPKVVLVPKSSNSPSSKNWLLHSSNLTDIQHHEVRGKVTFKFSVGSLQKGDFKTTVISAPHPSYTPRIGREFRESAQNAIFTVLQNC